MFDMLTGSPPWTSTNAKKVMDSIIKKKLLIPQFLTADAKDLLTKLLRKNPVVRMGRGDNGANDIRNHPFWRVDKRYEYVG
jgi:serine/threonine protein kinase